MQKEAAARRVVTTLHRAVGLMAMLGKARKTERAAERERKLLALLHRCTVM